MLTIETKTVRDFLNKAGFQSYRKRNVFLSTTTKVTFHGVNWSGGSKSEYRAICLADPSQRASADMGTAAPWNNPYEGLTVDLPPGVVIAESGWFCGKQSTLHLHVHPDNMPKLIK